MPSITVRDIPQELYDRLRILAEANRRSINSQIITFLDRSVGSRLIDPNATIAEARVLRERTAVYVLGDEELQAAKTHGRR